MKVVQIGFILVMALLFTGQQMNAGGEPKAPTAHNCEKASAPVVITNGITDRTLHYAATGGAYIYKHIKNHPIIAGTVAALTIATAGLATYKIYQYRRDQKSHDRIKSTFLME